MKHKDLMKKIIGVILLVLIATVSATVLTSWSTSVENHTETIEKLDEKKMTSMKLTAAVATASTAIAAVPGDATTPIAQQISELTNPLLIVVSAIYLEKFLLTSLGYVAFRVIVPIACLLMGIHVIIDKPVLKELAIKLSIFGLVIAFIIPLSMGLTTMIENTFEESINDTFAVVEEIEITESETVQESSGWLSNLANAVTDTVSELSKNAEEALSNFVDAIAVLIITTCVVPIAVLLITMWMIKFTFGLNITLPKKHAFKQQHSS